MATVASDADVALAGLSSVAELDGWFAWNRAIGFQATATDCETTAAGDVSCRYTYDNPWMQAAGIGPVAGNSMSFTFAEGLISSVSERLRFEAFAPVWDGFKDWVRRSHPGELDQILTFDDVPVLTDDALERWKLFSAQYTDSFALEALGNSFLDAFLSFDGEALRDIGGPAKDLGSELYLQEFSASSNYVASDRRCAPTVLRVTCTMVGSDDIAAALGGVTYTDTFVIEVSGDIIRSVEWSTASEPAGVFDGFFAWLQTTQQEVFAAGGPCEGFFEGGDTPGECALAFLDRVEDYLEA